MSYLLDTHVLLWLADQRGPTAKPDIAEQLADPDNHVVVSSVSAFEIATKVRLGKLQSARAVVDSWPRPLVRLGAEQLSLTARHGIAAGALDWGHRDPFDRLLVAQAVAEGMTLISADSVMRTAPGLKLLRW